MKRKRSKGQSSLSLITCNSKKKIVRGLGLFFFLIGAVLISDSFLNITGRVTGNLISSFSFWGLMLEIIGVALMIIKIETRKL